ncbi:MAG TPA: hypothetical protein PKK06_14040 [Phycisphaerae bacterium]|nr:hypothetical protein [Phycisphaerae bacterium]
MPATEPRSHRATVATGTAPAPGSAWGVVEVTLWTRSGVTECALPGLRAIKVVSCLTARAVVAVTARPSVLPVEHAIHEVAETLLTLAQELLTTTQALGPIAEALCLEALAIGYAAQTAVLRERSVLPHSPARSVGARHAPAVTWRAVRGVSGRVTVATLHPARTSIVPHRVVRAILHPVHIVGCHGGWPRRVRRHWRGWKRGTILRPGRTDQKQDHDKT